MSREIAQKFLDRIEAGDGPKAELATMALAYASDDFGTNDLAQTAIRAGADLNQAVMLESDKKSVGIAVTPLARAARFGHQELVPMLLEAGADPDVKMESGYTALHFAATTNNQGVIIPLLEAAKNPEAELHFTDKKTNHPHEGFTPLALADHDMAIFMLAFGCDYMRKFSGPHGQKERYTRVGAQLFEGNESQRKSALFKMFAMGLPLMGGKKNDNMEWLNDALCHHETPNEAFDKKFDALLEAHFDADAMSAEERIIAKQRFIKLLVENTAQLKTHHERSLTHRVPIVGAASL